MRLFVLVFVLLELQGPAANASIFSLDCKSADSKVAASYVFDTDRGIAQILTQNDFTVEYGKITPASFTNAKITVRNEDFVDGASDGYFEISRLTGEVSVFKKDGTLAPNSWRCEQSARSWKPPSIPMRPDVVGVLCKNLRSYPPFVKAPDSLPGEYEISIVMNLKEMVAALTPPPQSAPPSTWSIGKVLPSRIQLCAGSSCSQGYIMMNLSNGVVSIFTPEKRIEPNFFMHCKFDPAGRAPQRKS